MNEDSRPQICHTLPTEAILLSPPPTIILNTPAALSSSPGRHDHGDDDIETTIPSSGAPTQEVETDHLFDGSGQVVGGSDDAGFSFQPEDDGPGFGGSDLQDGCQPTLDTNSELSNPSSTLFEDFDPGQTQDDSGEIDRRVTLDPADEVPYDTHWNSYERDNAEDSDEEVETDQSEDDEDDDWTYLSSSLKRPYLRYPTIHLHNGVLCDLQSQVDGINTALSS